MAAARPARQAAHGHSGARRSSPIAPAVTSVDANAAAALRLERAITVPPAAWAAYRAALAVAVLASDRRLRQNRRR